jgi:shikimate kinase
MSSTHLVTLSPCQLVIFLIGPRGSGKSTVAALLAERLGMTWVDADALLEQQAGQTIRAIFATEGEAGFRHREAELLAELCHGSVSRAGQVIATGGGVVLRGENRRLLRQAGFVVWLTADIDTLWRRISEDVSTRERRPNLGVGGREEVAQVVADREPLYRECAHLTIDSSQQTPEQAVDQIVAAVNARRSPTP